MRLFRSVVYKRDYLLVLVVGLDSNRNRIVELDIYPATVRRRERIGRKGISALRKAGDYLPYMYSAIIIYARIRRR